MAENHSTKLSFIIPVYNLRDYVGPCLDSILSQGTDENLYEIILVDDGSSDGSAQVMEEYSSLHMNISVIRKPNGGVSSARNAGLAAARGDFVTFVDADDTVGGGTLERAAEVADASTADMVIMRILSGAGRRERYPWTARFQEGKLYSPGEILTGGYFRGSACSCLFRRKALSDKGISFKEGLALCEDTLFMSQCMAALDRIEFSDIRFYLVTEREGSASRSFAEGHLTGYGNALKAADALLRNGLKAPQWINYCKYQIMIRLSSMAAAIGTGPRRAADLAGLKNHLPIDRAGIPVDRSKILILNLSYSLFYYLILCRDRLKRK
ncbi:MAG: glycosyltransferase family 2 protein [Bacteroidales bacterium]|nr:glycosyltransferase family 2 protein [Bacteroidales bacterium]